MPNNRYRTPQDVARQLEISPSTLRRWSDEFAAYLSSEASAGHGKSHRRYGQGDLGTLAKVKELMGEGMTYEQVRHHLQAHLASASDGEETALVSAEDMEMATAAFISQFVENITESHRSVLNSQQANRELIGVVIQDNFNLKEENARLRERMLDLERQAAQWQRNEEARLEALRREFEMKLMEVREAANQRNPITILQNRPGCLASLFGGGSRVTQVEAPSPGAARTSQTPPRRSYPTPPGPPE
ncbi:MAG: MerR family transcriptional regulator [Anaerolineae bacterium]